MVYTGGKKSSFVASAWLADGDRRRPGYTLGGAPTKGLGSAMADDKLWEFYERWPEPNWFVSFVSHQFRLMRPYVAKWAPGMNEPQPLGTLSDEGEMVYTDEEQKMIEIGHSVRGDYSLTAGLLETSVQNLLVTGHYWTLGISRSLDVEDPFAEIDYWDVFSCSEVKTEVERYVKRDDMFGDEQIELTRYKVMRNGKWVTLPASTRGFKTWWRHPRSHSDVVSPFRAAYNTLCRLKLLDDVIDAAAESRLLGRGILIVPTEVDPPMPAGADVPEDWTFWDWLMSSMTEAIADRGVAAAAAPIVIDAPAEVIDQIRHLEFPLNIDELFIKLREELFKRLAVAWNVPTEQFSPEGIADMNHWNVWATQQSTENTTWRPLSETILEGWTAGILWPAAVDEGISDPYDYVFWYDLSEVVVHPNRPQESKEYYECGLITDEAARREGGYSEDDAASLDEKIERWLTKVMVAQPSYAPAIIKYFAMSTEQGMTLEELAEAMASADTSGDGQGPPPSMESTPIDRPVGTPPVMTAAASGGAAHPQSELIRSQVHAARVKTGNWLRNRAPKTVQESLRDVAPATIPAFLGRGVAETIAAGEPWERPGSWDYLRSRGVDVDGVPTWFTETLFEFEF